MHESASKRTGFLFLGAHPLVAQNPFQGQPQGDVRLEDVLDDALCQRGHRVSYSRAEHPVPRHLVLE